MSTRASLISGRSTMRREVEPGPSPRTRLMVGLFCALTTLLFSGIASAILVTTYRERVEDSARRDVMVIGTSVARALAQQFEKAARFDIPLKLLPGVESHLSDTLAGTPGLTQIVLRGADGREIRSAIGEIPGTDIVSAPVTAHGRPVASVEVSTNPAALGASFANLGVMASGVVALAALLSGLLGALFAGGFLDRRRRRLAAGLARNARGDFAPSGPARSARTGPVGQAFRALAQGARHVNARRQVFEAYADELLSVDFEGELRPDIEHLRREVMAKPLAEPAFVERAGVQQGGRGPSIEEAR